MYIQNASQLDLYNSLTMTKDLLDVHKKNARAVAAAYGLEKFLDDESKIIAALLKLYATLVT